MQIHLFTLFPEVCWPYLQASILSRAQTLGAASYFVHNIRDYATDKHHITDDTPYGGGGGMVMKPEPIFNAVEAHLPTDGSVPIILLTPQGQVFTQALARQLSSQPQIGLIAGRYEGVDERVREHLVTHELSIGDFVLTGGELPALCVIDALVRLLPGVLGDPTATDDDSFGPDGNLLEYPHYTRPPEYRGWGVPEILLSGHHAQITRWRREQALRRTLARRPDLLTHDHLSPADQALLKRLRDETPPTEE